MICLLQRDLRYSKTEELERLIREINLLASESLITQIA